MNVDRYLEGVRSKLQAAGYTCRQDADLEDHFDLVAQKSQSSFISKREEVLLLARFAALDVAGLADYAEACLAQGQSARQDARATQCIFAVALADDPDDLAVEEVQWGNHLRFPATIVIPIILDVKFGQLHYFQELPLLANLVYSQCRQSIHQYLLP